MKTLPFTNAQLAEWVQAWPTPFHIYDEKAIRVNARRLKAAFAWNKGFHEYFAVKAAPNPHLMALLREEGFGSDCSSMAELVLAQAVGNVGEDIMFTSNDTPAEEFRRAFELGAISRHPAVHERPEIRGKAPADADEREPAEDGGMPEQPEET